MPPKVQFSKEQIMDSALKIAREEGISSITVRKLAAHMGCSVAPIYVNFKNTEELLNALMERVSRLLWEYSTGDYTDMGFFNIGIGQLLFVRDYPQLFMDLLNASPNCIKRDETVLNQMVDIMMDDKKLEGLTREDNKALLIKMSVFTNGLSLELLKGENLITLDKALILMEETAMQLINSYRIGFHKSFKPSVKINLP